MREFVKRIHFIGVGGIGMSGIAEVLLDLDFEVSGSDARASDITERLRRKGARISIGHAAGHVESADAVVVSSAVADDNAEVHAARANKTPVLSRAEMLGELMRFRKGIAIAGAHGKTTTTSLVAAVLTAAGMDPTFIIGGVVNSARTNARLGGGEYMVAEADESDASFLHLQPQMAVVTNIDADHMQTYAGDFDKLRETYVAFLHNLPFYGLAVMCVDDEVTRQVSAGLSKPTLTYAVSEDADFRARNLRREGVTSLFEVMRAGESLGEFRLPLPGEHNVQNALAAIAIADKLQIAPDTARAALAEFEGIARRFEQLGRIQSAGGAFDLVDDYAHHPNEISATLRAASACWPARRIVTVFQPHRYSRTHDLFDDFVQLLGATENLFVTEVYAAGETARADADGAALCRALGESGNAPMFVSGLDELPAALNQFMREDDVLLTLGAGDIGQFARDLAEAGKL